MTQHSLAVGGRGSWVPPWPLISAKFLELRKRRVLMTVTLTAGPAREQAADINRRLVGAGISVYGLRQTHARLEDWFLSVTSRFGGEQ